MLINKHSLVTICTVHVIVNNSHIFWIFSISSPWFVWFGVYISDYSHVSRLSACVWETVGRRLKSGGWGDWGSRRYLPQQRIVRVEWRAGGMRRSGSYLVCRYIVRVGGK